jgi:hypothetical protein
VLTSFLEAVSYLVEVARSVMPAIRAGMKNLDSNVKEGLTNTTPKLNY